MDRQSQNGAYGGSRPNEYQRDDGRNGYPAGSSKQPYPPLNKGYGPSTSERRPDKGWERDGRQPDPNRPAPVNPYANASSSKRPGSISYPSYNRPPNTAGGRSPHGSDHSHSSRPRDQANSPPRRRSRSPGSFSRPTDHRPPPHGTSPPPPPSHPPPPPPPDGPFPSSSFTLPQRAQPNQPSGMRPSSTGSSNLTGWDYRKQAQVNTQNMDPALLGPGEVSQAGPSRTVGAPARQSVAGGSNGKQVARDQDIVMQEPERARVDGVPDNAEEDLLRLGETMQTLVEAIKTRRIAENQLGNWQVSYDQHRIRPDFAVFANDFTTSKVKITTAQTQATMEIKSLLPLLGESVKGAIQKLGVGVSRGTAPAAGLDRKVERRLGGLEAGLKELKALVVSGGGFRGETPHTPMEETVPAAGPSEKPMKKVKERFEEIQAELVAIKKHIEEVTDDTGKQGERIDFQNDTLHEFIANYEPPETAASVDELRQMLAKIEAHQRRQKSDPGLEALVKAQAEQLKVQQETITNLEKLFKDETASLREAVKAANESISSGLEAHEDSLENHDAEIEKLKKAETERQRARQILQEQHDQEQLHRDQQAQAQAQLGLGHGHGPNHPPHGAPQQIQGQHQQGPFPNHLAMQQMQQQQQQLLARQQMQYQQPPYPQQIHQHPQPYPPNMQQQQQQYGQPQPNANGGQQQGP